MRFFLTFVRGRSWEHCILDKHFPQASQSTRTVIKGVSIAELLPAFLIWDKELCKALHSKALFRSPCRYFLAKNEINVQAEGQHKKKKRVHFHVPMQQQVKTFLTQTPIKPNWLFLSHHSDILKERKKITHFHFHLSPTYRWISIFRKGSST